MLFTSVGIGGSLGPFLAGYLADIYGNYNMTFVMGIAASLEPVFSTGAENALRKQHILPGIKEPSYELRLLL